MPRTLSKRVEMAIEIARQKTMTAKNGKNIEIDDNKPDIESTDVVEIDK